MQAADDADDPKPPPLPKEGERRIVQDADARGIEVVLQGGETWYVSPLPLSPRGLRLAGLMEQLEAKEVALSAAQRTVSLLAARLDEAKDESEVAEAEKRLLGAVAARTKVADEISTTHREIAFHALRSTYRLTREEAGALVTQRRWPDILAALNGRDTERSQQEAAIELFQRMHALTKRDEGQAGPFAPASPSSSGGAGPA